VVITVAGRRFVFEPAALGRYRGHMYRGELRPDAAELALRLERLGLPTGAARAMAVVSGLEGGFDAIQTYDRNRFSWGFIQFGAFGGLPGLLQDIKDAERGLFEEVFLAAGIDVSPGRIQVRHRDGLARGPVAANRLHDDPRLWYPFLLAAQHEAIRDRQVKVAHDQYYSRILEAPLALPFGTVTLGALFEGDACGRAILFDRAVQRGVGATVTQLRRAARRARPGSPADAPRLLAAALALEPQYRRRWESVRRAFEV
jgi:hypothetical protein